jgi:hypothetical protein
MDLSRIEALITFVTWAVRIIENTGVALLLGSAAWCALIESITLALTVLKTLLAFAHRRFVHARDAFRAVREEIKSWSARPSRQGRRKNSRPRGKRATDDRLRNARVTVLRPRVARLKGVLRGGARSRYTHQVSTHRRSISRD